MSEVSQLEVFSHKFHCDSHIRMPLARVKLDECQEVLKSFIHLLPVHADEKNLEIWLLEKKGDYPDYKVLLTCSHFEDAGPKDLASLSVIVLMLTQLSENWEVLLNYLSIHSEKLILEILNPIPELITAIKEAA